VRQSNPAPIENQRLADNFNNLRIITTTYGDSVQRGVANTILTPQPRCHFVSRRRPLLALPRSASRKASTWSPACVLRLRRPLLRHFNDLHQASI